MIKYKINNFLLLSSSARLRSKTPTLNRLPQEKRQEQRDESMRRLLEWKQRMLQSPLSRKGMYNVHLSI